MNPENPEKHQLPKENEEEQELWRIALRLFGMGQEELGNYILAGLFLKRIGLLRRFIIDFLVPITVNASCTLGRFPTPEEFEEAEERLNTAISEEMSRRGKQNAFPTSSKKS